MKVRFLLASALMSTFTFAHVAGAASLLATPYVDPPAGGSVHCTVNNVGTKSVTVDVAAYNGAGGVAASTTQTVYPKEGLAMLVSSASSHFCAVTVVQGAKTSIRTAAEARNSGGDVVTTLPGN